MSFLVMGRVLKIPDLPTRRDFGSTRPPDTRNIFVSTRPDPLDKKEYPPEYPGVFFGSETLEGYPRISRFTL